MDWVRIHDSPEFRCNPCSDRGCLLNIELIYLIYCMITWLDMTTPPWCREKVMVYYYYNDDVYVNTELFYQSLLDKYMNYYCDFIYILVH